MSMVKYSGSHDPLHVKGFIIKYNTVEEGLDIANILVEYGYDIYNYFEIKKKISKWNCFISDIDNEFCLADFVYFKDSSPSIGYDEFLNRINKNFKNFKKIENPTIDPFGEEDWGHVQESLTTDDFKIGDRVKINKEGVKNMHNNMHISSEEYEMIRSNGIITYVNHYDNRVGITWENGDFSGYSMEYVKKLKGKKVKNLKIDPFEEENWGYTQENKKEIYILVTPKFYEYADKYNWNMRDFVGKVFKIKEKSKIGGILGFQLDSHDKTNHRQTNEFDPRGYYIIPYDCAEIVNPKTMKKRIENSEIDLFGEEIWE